jgi:tetratricopeptide (TPR) repeat protein
MAYADKAYRFRDHANEQDRMLIDAGYAYLHTGPGEGIRIMESMVERYPDDKQAYFVLANVTWEHTHDAEIAIRYMRRAIEIDPLYRGAYNALAYWYDNVGDLDQSIWAINKYIEIAPDEPNPYDTRGELYANNGKLDEAIASYKVALEKDPEYSWSRARLGHLLRAKGDYAAAEACYRRLLEAQPPMRSRARMYLACLSVYQGKLARGLEQLEQGLAADEIEDLRLDGYNDKLIAKARISEMKGNSAEALATIARLPRYETGSQEGWDGVYCEFLARSGDLEGAQRAANALRQALDRGHRFEEDYWYAKGWIEFEQGRYDKAADHFARATRIKPVFWNRFMLARAYLNSDRLAEATEMFDRTLNRYDEGWAVEPIWAATIHYYAGIASERSGWKDRATQHYQEFLSIWKDADPGIDLVDDAKQRLERLRRGT